MKPTCPACGQEARVFVRYEYYHPTADHLVCRPCRKEDRFQGWLAENDIDIEWEAARFKERNAAR